MPRRDENLDLATILFRFMGKAEMNASGKVPRGTPELMMGRTWKEEARGRGKVRPQGGSVGCTDISKCLLPDSKWAASQKKS